MSDLGMRSNSQMSKLAELKKELEELEHKEFMVQMIDHWSAEDYRYDRELHEKIIKVKADINFINKCLEGVPKKPRKVQTIINALEKISHIQTTTPREYELKCTLISEGKKQIKEMEEIKNG